MLVAIEWFRVDDETMQNVLSRTASNLLRDPEPRVRFTASCVLAATFPEKSDDLEGPVNVREIEKLMLSRVDRSDALSFAHIKNVTKLKNEGYLDSVLLFGEILQRSARVSDQRFALYVLCHLARGPTHLRLVERVLDVASNSTTEFSSNGHMNSLLARWTVDDLKMYHEEEEAKRSHQILGTFPHTLLGFTSRENFVKHTYVNVLSTLLIQPSASSRDVAVQDWYEQRNGVKESFDAIVRDVIENQRLGRLFGAILPLGFTGRRVDHDRAKDAEMCLIRAAGGKKKVFWSSFKDIIKLNDLVKQMFDCVATSPTVHYVENRLKRFSNVSESAVTSSFESLSKRFSKSIPDILLRAGGVRILIYLYRRLESTSSSSSSQQWLQAFAYCIKLLKSRRYSSAILRFALSVTHRIIRQRRSVSEMETCCEMIEMLLLPQEENENDDEEGGNVRDRVLLELVTRTALLVQTCVSETTKMEVGGEWGEIRVQMSKLAKSLEEQAAKLEKSVWGTVANDDDDDDEGIAEIQDVRVRRRLAYEQFVETCCHRTRYMNLTFRSLSNLERALRSSFSSCCEDEDEDNDESEDEKDVFGKDRIAIHKVLHELLSLSVMTDLPISIRDLVAKCLGYIHSVDPSRFASYCIDRERRRSSNPLGKVNDLSHVKMEFRKRLLRGIETCLVSESCDVVEAAVLCAENVLSTKSGMEAYVFFFFFFCSLSLSLVFFFNYMHTHTHTYTTGTKTQTSAT